MAINQNVLHNGNRNVAIVITEKAARYNVILLTCRKSTINPEIILANVFVIPINETSKALSVPGIP
jgi:hypothetical protein